jgi:antitoxin MazE
MANPVPLGKRVIDAFGGPTKLSHVIGWPISTIDSWKDKDSIPRWRLRDIRNAAQANQVALPDDFPNASTDVPPAGKSKKRDALAPAEQSARQQTTPADEIPSSVSVVKKLGENYALLMSRDVVEHAGLAEGSRVEIESSDDGRIVVTRSKRHFTLDELLAGMTPEREHPLDDDAPRGEEKL